MASADGLVAYRGAHKEIKQHESAQSKYRLDDAADQRRELQQSTQCPARGPGSADHFRADKDHDSGESRNMKPVSFFLFSQVLSAPFKTLLPRERKLDLDWRVCPQRFILTYIIL